MLVRPGVVDSMLDLQARWAGERRLVDGRVKPLSLDSSLFESRHVSRHFEHRQRQSRRPEAKDRRKTRAKAAANRRRSKVIRGLPKLSLAVDAASHLILAARAATTGGGGGGGGNAPFFQPLLAQARRRATVRVAVADGGYDSEANHVAARERMGVRSVIPPLGGRPTTKPSLGRHRRNMKRRFARRADQSAYGQRRQSETLNSMIKRNLGSAMRATTARRRTKELLLRSITRNSIIMQLSRGSQQSTTPPVLLLRRPRLHRLPADLPVEPVLPEAAPHQRLVHARVPERRALPAAIPADDSVRPAGARPAAARRLPEVVGNRAALSHLLGRVRGRAAADGGRVRHDGRPLGSGGVPGRRGGGRGLVDVAATPRAPGWSLHETRCRDGEDPGEDVLLA